MRRGSGARGLARVAAGSSVGARKVRYTGRMLRRARRQRAVVRLVAVACLSMGAAYAGGCTRAELSERPPCRGETCTCAEDPQQPLCKGFNERDDASLTEPFDGAAQDASEAGAVDAADADSDAPADSGDEAG